MYWIVFRLLCCQAMSGFYKGIRCNTVSERCGGLLATGFLTFVAIWFGWFSGYIF